MSEETKRVLKAFAAYCEIDKKTLQFFVRQWELTNKK